MNSPSIPRPIQAPEIKPLGDSNLSVCAVDDLIVSFHDLQPFDQHVCSDRKV